MRFINTSSEKAVNALKSSAAIQGNLNRLKEGANKNLVKFTKHN